MLIRLLQPIQISLHKVEMQYESLHDHFIVYSTVVVKYYMEEALSLNEGRDVGKYPMKVNQV